MKKISVNIDSSQSGGIRSKALAIIVLAIVAGAMIVWLATRSRQQESAPADAGTQATATTSAQAVPETPATTGTATAVPATPAGATPTIPGLEALLNHPAEAVDATAGIVEKKPAAPAVSTAPAAPVKTPVATETGANAAVLATTAELLKSQEFLQVKNILTPLCPVDPTAPAAFAGDSAERLTMLQQLGEANRGLFFTDIPYPEKKISYQVDFGDTLAGLAAKNQMTVDAVKAVNHLDPAKDVIFVEQQLVFYPGDWSIVIDRSEKMLYLFDGKNFFKSYPVQVGRQDRTPLGTFKIGSKVKDPTWYSGDREYPAGDVENILGTRLMRLEPVGSEAAVLRGYGIQGTPFAQDAPQSNGSVRLSNVDVEELFTIVPNGTAVTILE